MNIIYFIIDNINKTNLNNHQRLIKIFVQNKIISCLNFFYAIIVTQVLHVYSRGIISCILCNKLNKII